VANEVNRPARPSNLVLFAWLMGMSVVAIAAMSPAVLFLVDPARSQLFPGESTDPVTFVIGFAIANVILSAVAIAVGLHLEPSVRLGVPLLRAILAKNGAVFRPIVPILVRCSALAFGLVALLLACAFALRSQLPGLPDGFVFPPIWQGVLMMLGAAVREEILFRFFALNLFVWIAMKVFRTEEPATATALATNVLVAAIFAWMHLILAAPLLGLSAIAVAVATVLGTVAGVLLGWVYWRHGLLMAIYTHSFAGVLVYLGGRGLIEMHLD
jgi:membrane protease YdiL (CAAX protease family)